MQLEKRLCSSFLLGLRWQLIQWRYGPKAIRVETSTGTLSVCGAPVRQALGLDGKFQLKWLSEYWETWAELQQSAQLAALNDTAEEKLKQTNGEGKGEGKG